jgi:hypothetical protein
VGMARKLGIAFMEKLRNIARNACYHSVQDKLFFRFLSQNVTIKVKDYNFAFFMCV